MKRLRIRTRLTLLVALASAVALVAMATVAAGLVWDRVTIAALRSTADALDDSEERLLTRIDDHASILQSKLGESERGPEWVDDLAFQLATVQGQGEPSVETFDEHAEPLSAAALADRLGDLGSDDSLERTARVLCRTLPGSSDCSITSSVGDVAADSETGRLHATLDRLASTAAAGSGNTPAITVGESIVIGGEGFIVVASESSPSGLVLGTAFTTLIAIIIPLLTLVIAGITWLALGRALRPVESIAAQVEQIGGESLDRLVPVPPADDELRRLATTMNDMLDRLRQAQETQQRFISDASHELRSPVTAVRATLDVARANPDDADWERTADILERETNRLAQLVDDLLLLARLDEQPSVSRTANVDLDELCLAEATRPHPVGVTARIDAPARVSGNQQMVIRAVRNLVDNGAASAESAVELRVGVDGDGMAVVVVEDDGPGVPPRYREMIFDRFTRLDEARARAGDDAGGAGLGLAIVRQIAEAHGGEISVGEAGLGGAAFELRLPLATATADES